MHAGLRLDALFGGFRGTLRPWPGAGVFAPPAPTSMPVLPLSSLLRDGSYLCFSESRTGLPGGRGAPLASFRTPNLGNSLVNFSASAFAGGSGYGAPKHAGPSISLRLNF